MGVLTFNNEFVSPIAPARFFKAAIVDAANLIPKLQPQVGIKILQGEGGAGTIQQLTFSEGDKVTSVTIRIDELNEETLTFKDTVIEGDSLGGKIEKILLEVQLVPSESGGTIYKTVNHIHTLGDDVAINEQELAAEKSKAEGVYKAVEAYLLQNPEAYA